MLQRSLKSHSDSERCLMPLASSFRSRKSLPANGGKVLFIFKKINGHRQRSQQPGLEEGLGREGKRSPVGESHHKRVAHPKEATAPQTPS